MFNTIKLWILKLRRGVEVFPLGIDEVSDFLKNKFPEANIEIEDMIYYTCDYKTAKALAPLIQIPLALTKYKKEKFDCDDYSRVYWTIAKLIFPSLPLGRVNVHTAQGKHSLNFIIYKVKDRLSFAYIEPQSGKMSYWNYRPYRITI